MGFLSLLEMRVTGMARDKSGPGEHVVNIRAVVQFEQASGQLLGGFIVLDAEQNFLVRPEVHQSLPVQEYTCFFVRIYEPRKVVDLVRSG
jgi:hypothetical protein